MANSTPKPTKEKEFETHVDSSGKTWNVPKGDMFKHRARLEQLQLANEKEAMRTEQKRIEAEMALKQQEMFMREQERQDAIAERQDKVNASNQAMAMYGMQPSMTQFNSPASIGGDVLQSQGQLAQGGLGLIQQQMQNQGQMEQTNADAQNKMLQLFQMAQDEMALEKYKQKAEKSREAKGYAAKQKEVEKIYDFKQYVEQDKRVKAENSSTIKEGNRLIERIRANKKLYTDKGLIGDELNAKYAPTSIADANNYLMNNIHDDDKDLLRDVIIAGNGNEPVEVLMDKFMEYEDKLNTKTRDAIYKYLSAINYIQSDEGPAEKEEE